MVENERCFFTLSYYEEFVRRLREVYHFTTFREGKVDFTPPKLIMRHDIDADLEAALTLSSLERDLGIYSTYFFMVRCPLYNVFSSSGSEQVKQILADGHHFGLHFDCAIYEDISANNLNYYILRECELLERFFERPVEAISFHRPGHMELSGLELDRWPNSYERVFLEKFEYFSDSRGKWARGNPLESEAFIKKKNLHIAAHPLCWTMAPMTLNERLHILVQSINRRSEQYMSKTCEVWHKGEK